MAFLEDFAEAVTNYAMFHVVCNFVDRTPVPPATPGAININEVWSFRVKVENRGPLNMSAVELNVASAHGMLVGKSASGPFSNKITLTALSVNHHSTINTVQLYFKAPSTPQPNGLQLMVTYISSFHVNLNALLNSGGSSGPQGTVMGEVFP